MPTRPSAAQRAASAANGAHSRGPVTPAGRAIAAGNATQHGLSARGALLPSETVEAYEGNLAGWVETLRPATPGEAQLVSAVADVQFRLARLARLEQQQIARGLETAVAASAAQGALRLATELHQTLAAFEDVLGGYTAPVGSERAHSVVAPLRWVLERLPAADLPPRVEALLPQAIEAFQRETFFENVAPAAFAPLLEASRATREALAARLPALEAAVDAERLRLADEVLLGEDKELARLARHRAQLQRQLEGQLGALKLVRELAPEAAREGSGSFGGPVLVELRLVGRK